MPPSSIVHEGTGVAEIICHLLRMRVVNAERAAIPRISNTRFFIKKCFKQSTASPRINPLGGLIYFWIFHMGAYQRGAYTRGANSRFCVSTDCTKY